MAKQENLKAKYGISDEELKRATDQIQFGKIACDGAVIVALVDLVANGDIDGEKSSNAKRQLTFSSSEHKAFYYTQLSKCSYNDCYHRALIYALGITEDIRSHIAQVYDIEADMIKPRFKDRNWLTGTDVRVLKLAFNLYNDTHKCDVSEAFAFGGVTEYLLQAIALRYEVI